MLIKQYRILKNMAFLSRKLPRFLVTPMGYIWKPNKQVKNLGFLELANQVKVKF